MAALLVSYRTLARFQLEISTRVFRNGSQRLATLSYPLLAVLPISRPGTPFLSRFKGQAGRSNIRIQLAEGMGRNNKGKNGFCDVWEPERGQDFWKRKRKERINHSAYNLPKVDVHGILFAVVAVVFVVYPLIQWALGR